MKGLGKKYVSSSGKSNTMNEQTIESAKIAPLKFEEVKTSWGTGSSENPNFKRMLQRPLTANQTPMGLSKPLKKSCFYRKFMNQSINANPEQKFQSTSRQGCYQSEYQESQCLIKPQDFHIEIKMQKSRGAPVDEDNICNQSIKSKSFESFLENKRRKDIIKRRQEETHSLKKKLKGIKLEASEKADHKIESEALNLSGKGIIQLKERNILTRFSKNLASQNPENYIRNKLIQSAFPFQNNSPKDLSNLNSIVTLQSFDGSKLCTIQSESLNKETEANDSYIKYIFQEDQGYCLFHKSLHGQLKRTVGSKEMSRLNKRRLFYFDRQKSQMKHSNKEYMDVNINRIQGWIVSQEEEDFSTTTGYK